MALNKRKNFKKSIPAPDAANPVARERVASRAAAAAAAATAVATIAVGGVGIDDVFVGGYQSKINI